MIFDELPKIVIHLPERKDRWLTFRKELQYVPMEVRVCLGIKAGNPMKNIAQSHINAILYAKQNEWPEVLIMEDDVHFPAKTRTLPYINECLASLPESWDVLLGGIYESTSLEKHSAYWNKTGQFCGAHFYIVNSKAYDRLINYDGKHHFDRFMNYDGSLNCYVAKKMFAIQHNGYSDNAQGKMNYTHKLGQFELLAKPL